MDRGVIQNQNTKNGEVPTRVELEIEMLNGCRLPMRVLVLVFIANFQLAHAEIEKIVFVSPEAARCMHGTTPSMVQGSTKRIRLIGAWVDWSRRLISDDKISAQVVATNAIPAWVEVELRVGSGTTPGLHTITLDYAVGKDQFEINVLESAVIEKLSVPPIPSFPFRILNLKVEGRHLNSELVPSITLTQTAAGRRSLMADGTSGGRVIQTQISSSDETSGVLMIEFFRPMKQAVFDVAIENRKGTSCRPLMFISKQPVTASSAR